MKGKCPSRLTKGQPLQKYSGIPGHHSNQKYKSQVARENSFPPIFFAQINLTAILAKICNQCSRRLAILWKNVTKSVICRLQPLYFPKQLWFQQTQFQPKTQKPVWILSSELIYLSTSLQVKKFFIRPISSPLGGCLNYSSKDDSDNPLFNNLLILGRDLS